MVIQSSSSALVWFSGLDDPEDGERIAEVPPPPLMDGGFKSTFSICAEGSPRGRWLSRKSGVLAHSTLNPELVRAGKASLECDDE